MDTSIPRDVRLNYGVAMFQKMQNFVDRFKNASWHQGHDVTIAAGIQKLGLGDPMVFIEVNAPNKQTAVSTKLNASTYLADGYRPIFEELPDVIKGMLKGDNKPLNVFEGNE